jgi:serine/threonine-protein kinase
MTRAPEVFGRYALYEEIASGGMATVHFGRLLGPAGFARTVAIKRLHRQHAKDADFVTMFLDEARLAARIHHPNVVSTLDVVSSGGELLVVMDYVHGESLSRLMRDRPVPPPLAAAIVSGALHGLHAAHEAKNERGEPLSIVHRDVSPQNIIVGADGLARVLDFGIAKAVDRLASTRDEVLKGKLSYMAPEQLLGNAATRQSDVYAASVVLWEALTGQRLFEGEQGEIISGVMNDRVAPPSEHVAGVPAALDDIVRRGMSRDLRERYPTAHEMALAIESRAKVAHASEVASWLRSIARETLDERTKIVEGIESGSTPVARADVEAVLNEIASDEVVAPDVTVKPKRDEETASVLTTSVSLQKRRRAPWAFIAAGTIAAGAIALVLVTRKDETVPKETPAARVPESAPSSEPSPAPAPQPSAQSASPSASAPPPFRPIPRFAAPQPSRDVYDSRRKRP